MVFSEKRSSFAKNAVLLSAASVGLNLMGMAFRVYLSARMGADGMGLYTLILSVCFFASTFASAGLSLSVTRLVSEAAARGRREKDVLRRMLFFSVLPGTAAAGMLLCLSAPAGLFLLKDIRSVRPLRIYAFGLPFLGVSACLSGYFLAVRRVSDSIRWNFFDQGVKMLFTVLLLRFINTGDLEAACCGTMLAHAAGELASCAYGLLLCLRSPAVKNPSCRPTPGAMDGLLRETLCIALPVAAGAYFRSGLSALENILIPRSLSRLQENGLAEFGLLKGMALPVVSFPSAVPAAFCSLLIPEISEAAARNDQRKIGRLCSAALRGAFLYSIAFAGFFLFFGEPLGLALYGKTRAGELMARLSCAVPMLYLDSVSDSLLKALGQQMSSLRYNTLEGVSRILLLLPLLPLFGTEGFILVVFLSNALSTTAAIRRLHRLTDLSLRPAESLAKPVFCCLPAAFLSLRISRSFSSAVLRSAGGGICFFLFFLFFLYLSGCRDLKNLFSCFLKRKKPVVRKTVSPTE